MEKGAATLKRVFLELGGKSAMIVLEDADFQAVLPFASMACLHAGQGCSLQTRVLLPRSRYEEGVEILASAIAGVPYGDPQSMDVLMGPQISEKQRARVLGYIEKGIDEGARVVVGGGKPAHLPKGWYVEPTLFADVENSMTIAREEIFGPVIVAIPFEDEDDAVRIANDSPYGLAGAVHAATEERATSVARRVRAGALNVNGGISYGADSPYGGYKASGIGRQNGLEGFEQYLETKAIAWASRR
jgi:aldehyde dehydrogenase (NAD+)